MAASSRMSTGGGRAHSGGNGALAGQELPGGSCNFRDLRPGASVTSCGCKRFWWNPDHYTGHAGSQTSWCFCGHHACFHDFISLQRQHLQNSATQGPIDIGNPQHQQLRRNVLHAGAASGQRPNQDSPKGVTGLGIQQEQSQSIDARVWDALNGFARQQADGAFSDVPSTTAPSVVDEPRNSLGFVGQDIHIPQAHATMGPPINVPQYATIRPNAEDLSATEVNTPSIAGTPDFRATASSSKQMRPSPRYLEPERCISHDRIPTAEDSAGQVDDSQLRATVNVPAVRPAIEPSLVELQNLVRSYGQRLELIENLSFSHVPIEEVQDRFEHFDGRILDLEQWRAERDREAQQPTPEPPRPSTSKRRRLGPSSIGSFSSDRSFDSSAAAQTEAVVMATLATHAINDPRLESLETRVTELESASLPSYSRPWQVQVVLLPWGRHLRGVWFSSMDATQRSLRSATQDEWSGAQSMPKLSFSSAHSAAWTTESIQAWADEAHEWLSPKACGPSGTVFQRLASRGLVQDVTLSAPDSRSILGALRTAFGKVLPTDDSEARLEGTHQALGEHYIPLRKVRKSSRLRFLTPAEMVTSSVWDATLLDSSVFMKVGDSHRRLYLTTPNAYLQSAEGGWTWPKLRQLPLFNASVDEQLAQSTGTAVEGCWTYNENLDRTVSTQSSFASHASLWTSNSPAVQCEDDADDLASCSRSMRAQHHQRTVSLPISTLAASDLGEEMPQRRVASFETAGMVPTHADEDGLQVQAKRRRISLSPELERRGVNFTPRWSREPPSPFTSGAGLEANSQGAGSRNRRGTTPSAYATPHSNSQYPGRQGYFGGDGDTEADTDVASDQGAGAEEEWEGVQDDPASSPVMEGDCGLA